MALTTKYGDSWLHYQTASIIDRTRQATTPISYSDKTGKVKGLFITLPGGQKFRRATSYFTYESRREPGIGQSETGYQTFLGSRRFVYAYSSPGGYRGGDSLMSTAAFEDYYVSGARWRNPPNIPTNRRNEVYTKALLKLADQKANVGETLGTMRQTLDLIKNPGESLVRGLTEVWRDKSFRPFLFRSIRDIAKQPLNKAAQRYLEYVYGWKPLVSDIHGIMSLLKQQGSKTLLMSVSANSRLSVDIPSSGYYNASEGLETHTGPTHTKSLIRCNLHARLDPNAAGLRALNQLGLANPLATAWELMSWSFVIDWFIPIGPVLNALSAPAGLIFVNGSISNRVSQRAPYESWYNGIQKYTKGGIHANGVITHEGYARSELTSWPIPGFWVDPNPFRADRPLKALALAITNLRSFR